MAILGCLDTPYVPTTFGRAPAVPNPLACTVMPAPIPPCWIPDGAREAIVIEVQLRHGQAEGWRIGTVEGVGWVEERCLIEVPPPDANANDSTVDLRAKPRVVHGVERLHCPLALQYTGNRDLAQG